MDHKAIQVGVCLVDSGSSGRFDTYCVVRIDGNLHEGVRKIVHLYGQDRSGIGIKKILAGDMDGNWRIATAEESQPALKAAKDYIETKVNEWTESLARVNSLVQS